MADISVSDIRDYRDEIERLGGNLDALSDRQLSGVIEGFTRAGIAATSGASAVATLSTSIEKLSGFLDKTKGKAKEAFASGLFEKIKEITDTNSEAFQKFGTASLLVINSLIELTPRAADTFRGVGKAGIDAGNQISDAWEGVPAAFKKVFDIFPGGAKAIGNLVKEAEPIRRIEESLLRTAAASGDFNNFVEQAGSGLRDLGNMAANFTNYSAKVADATQTQLDVVMELAEQYREIPGFLDQYVQASGRGGESTRSLEAVMRVARGTGQSFNEVFAQSKDLFLDFGMNAQRTTEIIASMGRTAQNLGMRIELVRDFTMQTARSFREFGDNTEGAMNILAGMTKALSDSGLGQRAIIDLTKNFTDAITQMDVAHKAFISGAAGARGGIGGALDIDLMLREGRTDEVMGMVQKALQQQVGGRIVTLEEAARNPALEGQLLQQRAMMRDVFGIARTDVAADRMAQAMAQGDVATFGAEMRRETPQESLQKAMDTSVEWDKRQYTELTKISNHAKVMAMALSMRANEGVRAFLGQDSPFARGLLDTMNKGRQAEATATGAGPGRTTATQYQAFAAEQIKQMFTEDTNVMFSTVKERVAEAQQYLRNFMQVDKERTSKIGQELSALGVSIDVSRRREQEGVPLTPGQRNAEAGFIMRQLRVTPRSTPTALPGQVPGMLEAAMGEAAASTRGGEAAPGDPTMVHIIIDNTDPFGNKMREEIDARVGDTVEKSFKSVNETSLTGAPTNLLGY